MATDAAAHTGTPSFDDLPKSQRRRLVVVSTLRTVGTIALLVALYYLLPLDNRSDATTVAELVLGIVAMVVVVIWQVRKIIESPHPNARATESLAFTVPLYLLLFSTTYFLIERSLPSSFTEPLTRTDALYFSATVFTTVGFGDISAKSQAARLLVTGQMMLDLVLLGLVVKLFLGAVKLNQQQKNSTSTGGS